MNPEPPPGRGGASRRILVLCCGEPSRGDDAAAYLAAALLPELLGAIGGHADDTPAPSRALGPDATLRLDGAAGPVVVEVRLVGQLEPDDLAGAGPDDAVVVADAVRGVPAGTLVHRDIAELAAGGPSPRSSHVLPLRDVLGLVVVLRGSLPAGSFVGIGGAAFGIGEDVSAPVRAALPSFADAIAAAVLQLARRTS